MSERNQDPTPSTDPMLHAVVRADGTAAVTVDGVTQEIRAADEDSVRQQILERARQRAVIAGHPVRLSTSEPAGRWWLIVHANGQVFEDRSVREPDPYATRQPPAQQQQPPAPPVQQFPAEQPPYQPDPFRNDPFGQDPFRQDPFQQQPPPANDSDSTPWSAAIDESDDDEPAASEPARHHEWTPERRSVGALVNLSPTHPSDYPAPPSRSERPAAEPSPPAPPAPVPQQQAPGWPPSGPDQQPPAAYVQSAPPPRAPQPPAQQPPAQQPPAQQQPAPQQPAQQPAAAPQNPPPPGTSAADLDDDQRRHEPPPSDVLEVQPPGEEPFRKPTLEDLLETRPKPKPGPAEWGVRGALRKVTFGAVKFRPSSAEMQHRMDVSAIQRSLSGPKTVAVVNPKGGASKTTTCYLIGATFGLYRGGYTLAWDNNETRGTLGWRSIPARHTNTAVDLLADIERFQAVDRARVGDLDNYVRTQGTAQFDVLASDEDAARSATLDGEAFDQLHQTLSRFYRLLIIDTGNNMRASNWIAAVEAADLLVISSSVREDTASSAAWLIDGLRARGLEHKVESAVTVLSAPAREPEEGLSRRLHDHFGRLTRAVLDVPHDPALVDGGTIEIEKLHPQTREAWVHVTAAIADGL
ncbi:MinD/ParA family ATP-binding protein [Microlunatus parietis]|uniref:MinD-like ATPase involved in chromosome partitioning or flagellar assembly n=1 Tax=Microlunatus parietis TaxID=682979 RepID=A0A7Y9IB50_9ACTN|nr:chromosome partitioning protein [Microlunatus parietis]NYE73373.1 MinD-like ATPase involved in chromosome partitioning or flagellar assembly [Microlunatus parietis]